MCNVNSDVSSIKDGRSPLWIASCDDKLDIVKVLIQYGADVNLQEEVVSIK